MIMKWLNFKSTLYTVLALFLFCPEDALAQADKSDEEETKDTVLVSKSEPSKYDKRIHRFRKGWNSLIPTHNKIQFAGNMGMFSFGTGWDYGRRDQWETDLFLGFIPKHDSHRTKLTMTLKQNYMPWSLELGKGFSTEPLSCKELSAYLTKNFGKGFSVGNLKNIRQFYKVYSEDQIGETVFSQFGKLPAVSTGRKFYLSWSHYLKLMRINRPRCTAHLHEAGRVPFPPSH